MGRFVPRTREHHDARRTAHARAAFVLLAGAARAPVRAAEIAALPTVDWKGQTLRTITCHGTTGKGPHPANVPEGLLWALIEIRAYRCPFHA